MISKAVFMNTLRDVFKVDGERRHPSTPPPPLTAFLPSFLPPFLPSFPPSHAPAIIDMLTPPLFNHLGMPVDPFHHELIFKAYDKDHSDTIDFAEFISVLSILQRGTAEEKLEMSFHIYDLDGDGSITREELKKIVEAIFKVRSISGDAVASSNDHTWWKTPDQFVDHLFKELDANGDGKITLQEYKNGALRDPNICKSLNLI